MSSNRAKNASRNIVSGVVLKLYQMFIPFLMRTLMIYTLGIQYLGLNSLFASVISILNLAELGVGSAMVYSMYQPIIDSDTKKICSLMWLYKWYYRIIGFAVLVIGMLLTPALPKLVKGDMPADISLYGLYFLNLGATVLSYWLFAYRTSILVAHQRNDVISKITLATNTVQYLSQIIVLVFIKNYYLYVLCILLTQVLTNVVTAIAAKKRYPEYLPKKGIDSEERKKINGRIKDLFTSKLGVAILFSADTLVISAFFGLSDLAIYQNYYFIVSSVSGFALIIFQSVTAGIGNSLLSETIEKNFEDLKKFTFMISTICMVCVSMFLSFFQPFMRIWMGEDYLLPFGMVICFCIYFFFLQMNQLMNVFKDAAGLWHSDRFRPLCTALTNLGLNIVLVQFIGIYGILVSTILSWLIVGWPWLLHNLFRELFYKEQLKEYLMKLFQYFVVTFGIFCLLMPLISWFSEVIVLEVIARVVLSVAGSSILWFLYFGRTKEWKDSVQLIRKMMK